MNLERYHAERSIQHQPFRSACYAPHVGLSFDLHGMVSVCGFTRSTPLGRVGQQSLMEMWRGPVAERLRDAVRSDDLDTYCARCAEEIAGGNLHGLLASGFDRFTAAEHSPWPARMEFALSNACNLQCAMCSGEFSSAIRSHREGLPRYPQRYGEAFLDELRPFLPHLAQARFLGGEPFLAEINFRIWELMVEEDVAVECNVTTNGTQWNQRIEAALDRLPFSLGVSVDGLTAGTVESIRVGASHEVVMENIGRFLAHRDRCGTSVSLTFCLMVQNWHEFGDFLRFAEERRCQVYVNTVRQPPEFSLYRLPVVELRSVVARLESVRETISADLELNRAVWNEQLDRLGAHLDQLGALGDAAVATSDEARHELMAALADPASSEEQVRDRLRAAAHDGIVDVVRCDFDDDIVVADRYAGLDVAHLVGSPSATLYPHVAERYGRRVDVLGQRVHRGAAARVISYDDPGRPATVLAVVTRRGPEPFATTKLAAVLEPARPLGAPSVSTVHIGK